MLDNGVDSKNTEFEREIAKMIIDGLNLSIDINNIQSDMALFGEGLGLDSIDALEMVLILQNQYGISIKQGDPENNNTFRSIKSLADFIYSNKTK